MTSGRPTWHSWAYRFQIRQHLKGSLWFVPMIGALLGPLLASADLLFENHVDLTSSLGFTAGNASGVLTAIVGAMVGLLGFVVTIGVLVVQTATSTLSPRFMRIWYRDPLQKAVLATFAGTFTFAFTLLRRVRDDNVPSLGVTVAGLLVTLSLLMLLVFLDHFTHSLRPVAVGAAMLRYGEESLAAAGKVSAAQPWSAPRDRVPTVIPSNRAGVIQALHTSTLVTLAQRHQCVIVLTRTPGDLVSRGTPVMEVYGDGPIPEARTLTGLLALGIERTIDQDPAFALRILVDIAIRALSPAVNDPTTAIQMLNHIELFLEAVAESGPRTGVLTLCDATGEPRLIVPARRFDDYLQLAVDEIMQYGGSSTQVCRRLSGLLDSLADLVAPEDRPAIAAEVATLDAVVAVHFPDPAARLYARTPDSQGIGGPAAL